VVARTGLQQTEPPIDNLQMGPGRAAHGQRTALPAARLGGALVCVGSTMTFVFGATVPSYSNGQPMAVLLPSVVAFVFGLWCIAMGARTHRYVVYAIPSAAALAMSGSLWVTDTALESSELLFVWCVLFASYFMPTAPAAANTVFVAASYAAVVIGRRGLSVGLPPAIELAATAAVACILVLRLRRQVESSLDDALEQARTDPLTRVLNRRGFSEALAVEIARARRAGEPLSALMIDLDHFKRLNDTHGHAAGDRTLQQVAQVLRTQLRGHRRGGPARRRGVLRAAAELPGRRRRRTCGRAVRGRGPAGERCARCHREHRRGDPAGR
jgi:hypothetical protein